MNSVIRRDSSPPHTKRAWWIAPTVVPFGFTTWAAFLYIGIKTRRASFFVASGVYAAMLATYLILDTGNSHGAAEAVATILAITAWIGGFVHAMAVRQSVAIQLSIAETPTIATASRELQRREYGRRLIDANPALARETGVGRPDLVAGDSFGLIDVNHAGPIALIELPGFTEEMANKVAEFCKQGGSFISVEDLALFLDFPAQQVDALRDRAVFMSGR